MLIHSGDRGLRASSHTESGNAHLVIFVVISYVGVETRWRSALSAFSPIRNVLTVPIDIPHLTSCSLCLNSSELLASFADITTRRVVSISMPVTSNLASVDLERRFWKSMELTRFSRRESKKPRGRYLQTLWRLRWLAAEDGTLAEYCTQG